MSGKLNSFSKKEHLCGDKRIGRLFENGTAFIAYPLRISYFTEKNNSEQPLAKVLVSVPKKRLKKAVARNRIKRLIRESYRTNKHSLWECLSQNGLIADIAFQYIANELLDFASIEKKMRKSLEKIIFEINEHQKDN
jgi:ribonuclease P protein component